METFRFSKFFNWLETKLLKEGSGAQWTTCRCYIINLNKYIYHNKYYEENIVLNKQNKVQKDVKSLLWNDDVEMQSRPLPEMHLNTSS